RGDPGRGNPRRARRPAGPEPRGPVRRGRVHPPRLLAWQWSDYAGKHRDRGNLLLHLVVVPVFQLGTVILGLGAVFGSLLGVAVGLAGLAAAIVLEGRGHAREPERPTP